MNATIFALALTVSAPAGAAPSLPSGAPVDGMERVGPADLRVESGAVSPSGTVFQLRRPMIRALVRGGDSSARLDFLYLGPSHETALLASGELRRQIGIKLRARDTCNVVYVMWHVAPSHGIHVEAKLNPESRTHAECHDRGYRRVDPTFHSPVSPIAEGTRHSLVASVDGRDLRVLADGELAWSGLLPPEILHLQGPLGFRSDNGEFDIELWTEAGP